MYNDWQMINRWLIPQFHYNDDFTPTTLLYNLQLHIPDYTSLFPTPAPDYSLMLIVPVEWYTRKQETITYCTD